MMSRRQRLLALIAAHSVLLGLLFQIAAFDHWRPQMEDILGIEGSHLHAAHCHGASASCAEGGGTVYLIGAGPATLPSPRPVSAALVETTRLTPIDPSLADVLHPPQAV
jgi:hypothetical protein